MYYHLPLLLLPLYFVSFSFIANYLNYEYQPVFVKNINCYEFDKFAKLHVCVITLESLKYNFTFNNTLTETYPNKVNLHEYEFDKYVYRYVNNYTHTIEEKPYIVTVYYFITLFIVYLGIFIFMC